MGGIFDKLKKKLNLGGSSVEAARNAVSEPEAPPGPAPSAAVQSQQAGPAAAQGGEPEPQAPAQPAEPAPEAPAEKAAPSDAEESSDAAKPEAAQGEEEGPKGAQVNIWVSDDHMEAFVKVTRPEDGGAHVTEEEIQAELERLNITTGIAENVGKTVARLHLYDKGFTIARGLQPVNGQDGVVEDNFPRDQEIRLEADAQDVVDFKNLHLVHDVKEGDVICRITLPTKAVNGADVFGRVVTGRDGKAVAVPMGKNTQLSDDGTLLLAAKGGNVVFQNGKFNIESTLRISGSVDNAVGNITFSGDVAVEGDVCEGYEVHAGGNVTIRGSVEGANVTAGGNISIGKGMNGMLKGVMEAGGEVRCRFLENCTVHAQGDIVVESILNCNVSSDNKVEVKGRRGVIVGGTCAARAKIEAKVIGAMSHIPTELSVGATPELAEHQKELLTERDKLELSADQHAKDIAYLVGAAQGGKVSKERLMKLKEMREDHNDELERISAITAELQVIEAELEEAKGGRISCMELYPPVKITMGGASISLQAPDHNCSYYFSEGQIKRGSVV